MNEPEILFIAIIATAMFTFVVVLICIAWVFAKAANSLPKMASHAGPRTQILQNPTVRPALERIRDAYHGRLLPGPMYELPRLTFDHQGVPVMVEANTSPPQSSMQTTFHISVRFAWPEAAFRMELYPDDLLAQLKKLFGMRDIEVGDAEFDRKYMISGRGEAQVKRFLSPRVRELIMQIRGPGYSDDIHLRVVRGHLWISKRSIQGDYEQIQRLIELSLALYEAALAQPLAGIEFLDELIVNPDSPICQVCGEAIAGSEVMCGQCRTPHHRECWHYFGGCSIYGCRGREFEPYAIARAEH